MIGAFAVVLVLWAAFAAAAVFLIVGAFAVVDFLYERTHGRPLLGERR